MQPVLDFLGSNFTMSSDLVIIFHSLPFESSFSCCYASTLFRGRMLEDTGCKVHSAFTLIPLG